MIKVNIVCVGKIKEQFYRDAVAEYIKRLSRFCRAEICELAEGRSLEEEGETILRRVRGYVIALCVEGQKLSSTGLAARMKQLCDGGREITFIIGSSCGLAEKVKAAVLEVFPKAEIVMGHVGPVIGAHLGNNCVAIMFEGNGRIDIH